MCAFPLSKAATRTGVCTILALLAFAGNSILCRMALGNALIDAATFSTVRLSTGAATLVLLMTLSGRGKPMRRGTWRSAGALFMYAGPFSFAYGSLTTASGALILFGTVQVTMILAALKSGERPGLRQWLGLSLALGGLAYLMFPGLSAPPLVGALLMSVAGVSWGIYSLIGRGNTDPLAQTTGSFVRAVPFAVIVSLCSFQSWNVNPNGLLLATASGVVASALGYALWYTALPGLTATRAAVVQLAVPILAAAGGIAFMGERVTPRLITASIVILGGVAVTLMSRSRSAEPPAKAS